MKTNSIQPASTRKVLLALLLALPVAAQAQFTFVTNNGAITITGYTGPGGAVTIPDTINGLPVTTIGQFAFFEINSLISVTIPNSITNIGNGAFSGCTSLTGLSIPDNILSIGDRAFAWCTGLASVAIGNGARTIGRQAFDYCLNLTNAVIGDRVTNLGDEAFSRCYNLSHVTIGHSVTNIGTGAFADCYGLTSVTIPASVVTIGDWAFGPSPGRFGGVPYNLQQAYFEGHAPNLALYSLNANRNLTVFYLPGTAGWGPTFGDRPTAPWVLPYPLILNLGPGFGAQTNGFGFVISWATNLPVVVEASADLDQPVWTPVSTNTLVNGSSHFSDPDWTNHPARFYRLRSP